MEAAVVPLDDVFAIGTLHPSRGFGQIPHFLSLRVLCTDAAVRRTLTVATDGGGAFAAGTDVGHDLRWRDEGAATCRRTVQRVGRVELEKHQFVGAYKFRGHLLSDMGNVDAFTAAGEGFLLFEGDVEWGFASEVSIRYDECMLSRRGGLTLQTVDSLAVGM